MNVAVLVWRPNSLLSQLHSEAIAALGHRVVPVSAGGPIPAHVDTVFVDGPYGSLVPLANRLRAMPLQKRPTLILWMSEQFWNPRIPTWLGRPLSQCRTRLEQLAYREKNGLWQPYPYTALMVNSGIRFRYFGDALWLRSAGLLTHLFVKSDWTQHFLSRRGICARVAYNGYTPAWGSPLNLQRDIDVLWLGTPGSRRRARLLQTVRQQLGERGIKMMVVDGKEHAPVHGEARTVLLNRTKIVLNLLRQPWDSNYLRYLLAMSNGAMVVGEPTYRHAPFQPGAHLAIAPPQQLADAIAYYCRHEAERRAVADRAYAFITTQFTLQQSMEKMFTHLEKSDQRGVVVAP